MIALNHPFLGCWEFWAMTRGKSMQILRFRRTTGQCHSLSEGPVGQWRSVESQDYLDCPPLWAAEIVDLKQNARRESIGQKQIDWKQNRFSCCSSMLSKSFEHDSTGTRQPPPQLPSPFQGPPGGVPAGGPPPGPPGGFQAIRGGPWEAFWT